MTQDSEDVLTRERDDAQVQLDRETHTCSIRSCRLVVVRDGLCRAHAGIPKAGVSRTTLASVEAAAALQGLKPTERAEVLEWLSR